MTATRWAQDGIEDTTIQSGAARRHLAQRHACPRFAPDEAWRLAQLPAVASISIKHNTHVRTRMWEMTNRQRKLTLSLVLEVPEMANGAKHRHPPDPPEHPVRTHRADLGAKRAEEKTSTRQAKGAWQWALRIRPTPCGDGEAFHSNQRRPCSQALSTIHLLVNA
jgi:hypothetical protein